MNELNSKATIDTYFPNMAFEYTYLYFNTFHLNNFSFSSIIDLPIDITEILSSLIIASSCF